MNRPSHAVAAALLLLAAAAALPVPARAQQPSPAPAATPAPAAALFTPATQIQAGHLPTVLRNTFARLAHDETEAYPFTETRTLSLSRQPIRQPGTLRSSKRYGLSLVYDGAKPRTIIVDDKGLIERQPGGKERQFNTADHPELGALTDLYLNLLRGNSAKLFEYADVSFVGRPRDWQMGLAPRDPAAAKRVGKVIISGKGRNLLRVENLLPNGDTRVLELGPVDRNPRLTPEQIAAFFRQG